MRIHKIEAIRAVFNALCRSQVLDPVLYGLTDLKVEIDGRIYRITLTEPR